MPRAKDGKIVNSRRFAAAGLLAFFALLAGLAPLRAAEKNPGAPSWLKPQIRIYQPPKVGVSTSTVFRTVDPQIIQKLIDLLEETTLTKQTADPTDASLNDIKTYRTPEGLRLWVRYQHLGVALSESLAWEPIKDVRVISEQNLKQRLTTVARWDHSPVVRSIALVSLAQLKDKNDLVYFKEALWSRTVGIRFATIAALEKWDNPADAVPILQELLKKDESFFIRIEAAGALAHMDDAEGFAALRKGLEDKDWMVRALAAKFLGKEGDHTDYDRLLQQLSREQSINTNDFVIAEISIAALKLFPQKIAWDKQERERKKNEGAVQPPIAARAKPPAGGVFELEPLIVTAPRLKIPQGELVDPQINYQLLRMMQQKENLRLTEEQINQSIAYKDLDSLETPEGILLKQRYTELGYLLTEGLAGTKDFQLLNELQRVAREGNNEAVRSYALVALAYSKDRIHLSLFQDALRKSLTADRFAAIEALELWGFPEASSILIGVTKLDQSPILRVYAAQAALRLGEPIGKDYLIRALDDQDWVARAMAMRYLGELGTGQDYNRLLAYLGSQQKEIVQAEMCSALLRLYAKKQQENQQP